MDKDNIQTLRHALSEGSLLDASLRLCESLHESGYTQESQYLHERRRGYGYMLQYAATGHHDPHRDKVISALRADCLGILREVESIENNSNSSALFFSKLRLDRLQKISAESLLRDFQIAEEEALAALDSGTDAAASLRRKEDILDRIFDKALVLSFADKKDLSLLTMICSEDSHSLELRSVIAGGLFLSFAYTYNRNKLKALFDILSKSDDEKMLARLFVYIFLILTMHYDEVESDSELAEITAEWASSIVNYTRLRDVIYAFLQSMDTARVSRKLEQEIIPGLQSISPELRKSLGKNYTREDLEEMAFNPQWEELLHKSGLEDKMREITELQQEGADVMMVPMAQMKKHPFFNRASVWFTPFTTVRSELLMLRNSTNGAIDVLFDEKMEFCDSDRYSLAVNIVSMPEYASKMLFSQLSASMEQVREDVKEKLLRIKNPDFSMGVVRHMRDLYRFFTLFRNNRQMMNPFLLHDGFTKIKSLAPITSEEEVSKLLSEFYFKRGYYSCALPIFESLTLRHADDSSLWEKIGFSLQSLSRPQEALDAYRKSEVVNPENPWLWSMISICAKNVGDYKTAAEYCRKILDADPDNLRKIRKCILALIRAGEYKNALHLSHKADFLQEDDPQNVRLLVLSAALDGNDEEMEKNFSKLILLSASDNDRDSYFVATVAMAIRNHPAEAADLIRSFEPEAENRCEKVMAELKNLGLYDALQKSMMLILELAYLKDRPERF